MRITFDHQVFSLQNAGGISRHFFELIKAFSSSEGLFTTTLMGFSDTLWPVQASSRPNGRVVHWGPRLFSSGMLTYALNELLLDAYALSLEPADIYHSTLYRFMPTVRARRRVATHHDCIQERFPEFFADRDRIIRTKRRMFQQADMILCVSEASRNDLQEFYGVEPERSRVVYNGITPMRRSERGRAELDGVTDKPFLLYVGSRAPYKGFDNLLKTFARSGLYQTYDLLVLGGGAMSPHELESMRNLKLAEHVTAVPYASPGLLTEAYAAASLFVYPSLYEGFGLPPLEAMTLGTPALVGTSPATLEICKDAPIFFNPSDADDFIDKLHFALEDEAARRLCIARGHALVQRHQSWHQTAEKVMDAYASLLSLSRVHASSEPVSLDLNLMEQSSGSHHGGNSL